MASTIYELVLYNREYLVEEKYGDCPEYNTGNSTLTSSIRKRFIAPKVMAVNIKILLISQIRTRALRIR